jgi:hypothetical protein
MPLLARTAIRSLVRSAPRRGPRFYSEHAVIEPAIVEPSPQWLAQQEALQHHAHGSIHPAHYNSYTRLTLPYFRCLRALAQNQVCRPLYQSATRFNTLLSASTSASLRVRGVFLLS